MMTRGGEGGKKCPKFDDVICERPLITLYKEDGRFKFADLTFNLSYNLSVFAVEEEMFNRLSHDHGKSANIALNCNVKYSFKDLYQSIVH